MQLLLELHLVQNRSVDRVAEATLVLTNPLPRLERVLCVTLASLVHLVCVLDVFLLDLRRVCRLQQL